MSLYANRLPRNWRFRLDAIPVAKRTKTQSTRVARAMETQQILSKIASAECVILLDERGSQWSTREFATRLSGLQAEGRDLCLVIGGPDGVDADCRKRADFVWSLSRLTLPHGLARIVCIEQLYRAATLAAGHPYHRE